MLEARLETLRALVEYADAIEAMAWPVPREMLLEIRLHRALLGQTHVRTR